MDHHVRNPSQDEVTRGRLPGQEVALDHVPAAVETTLIACAERAGCRIFRAADGRDGAFVVLGDPQTLAALSMLVAPLKGLERARETLTTQLGAAASTSPLPAMDADLYKKREVSEGAAVPAGTTLLVTREFSFDAAHNLPRYEGKCERLHGHSYRLRVTVEAPLDSWSGLCFDFHDIKELVTERVVKVLDHQYLNEFLPNPSAEHLAVWAWERLEDLPLHEIQVWETPTSFVTYHGPPPADG